MCNNRWFLNVFGGIAGPGGNRAEKPPAPKQHRKGLSAALFILGAFWPNEATAQGQMIPPGSGPFSVMRAPAYFSLISIGQLMQELLNECVTAIDGSAMSFIPDAIRNPSCWPIIWRAGLKNLFDDGPFTVVLAGSEGTPPPTLNA